MEIINVKTLEVLATIITNHSMTLDEALGLTCLNVMQTEEDYENGDGLEYKDLELVTSLDDYKKDLFESMVDDFMDYHPEHSDLLTGEAERDESGDWVSYAEDDTHIYLLHDTGDGNIVLDYFAAK